MQTWLRLWMLASLCALTGCAILPDVNVTPREHLYIADKGNHRIVRLDDMDGKGWATLGGEKGTEAGQLDSPQSVYVDGSEHIYIADTGNSRIVRTDDMAGKNWTNLGRKGDGNAQFTLPTGIYVDRENRIYVADRNNDRVTRMEDMNATHWVAFGAHGKAANQFTGPTGIYVDSNEKIYITDSISVVNGMLNNRLVRIDDMDGANWRSLSEMPGNQVGAFNNPSGICMGAKGRIYVADTFNNRILRMDSIEGKNWVALGGSAGGNPGQFNQPTGVFVEVLPDGAEHIYIADSLNNRIVRVDDMTGKNWVSFGTAGSSQGQFDTPTGIFAR